MIKVKLMRLLIYISTIFIAALLPQIKNFSLPVNISRHLRDNPAYASIKTDSVLVLVKSDNKILAKAPKCRKVVLCVAPDWRKVVMCVAQASACAVE